MNGGAGGVFNSTNVVLAVLPSDPTSACSRQANGGAAVAVGGGLTFHESNGFFLSRKCISRYIFHVPSWKLGHIRIHAIHAVQTVIVVDDYYDPGVFVVLDVVYTSVSGRTRRSFGSSTEPSFAVRRWNDKIRVNRLFFSQILPNRYRGHAVRYCGKVKPLE